MNPVELIGSIALLLPINGLIVHGFYHATTYQGYETHEETGVAPMRMEWKNILWWVRYYGQGLPWYLRKPIFECPQCMSSVHGAIPFTGFILIAGVPLVYLVTYPLYVLALSFTDMLIGKLYE